MSSFANKRFWYCDYCKKPFASYTLAERHEQQCPLSRPKGAKGPPTYYCDHCNQPFATYDLAEQHEQQCPLSRPFGAKGAHADMERALEESRAMFEARKKADIQAHIKRTHKIT